MKSKSELGTKEIFNSRLINFPKEKIFKAFSESRHLKKWWGPKDFTNTFKEFNFSKDGIWDFIMHGPDGNNYKNTSKFLEIIKPDKIVIEHISAPHFILTITLEEEGDKTRINWSGIFDSVEIRNNVAKFAIEANEQNFDRLEKECALIE